MHITRSRLAVHECSGKRVLLPATRRLRSGVRILAAKSSSRTDTLRELLKQPTILKVRPQLAVVLGPCSSMLYSCTHTCMDTQTGHASLTGKISNRTRQHMSVDPHCRGLAATMRSALGLLREQVGHNSSTECRMIMVLRHCKQTQQTAVDSVYMAAS